MKLKPKILNGSSANIKKLADQSGQVNVFLVLFIITLLMFFGALGFGVWAYGSRQDYKNNTDQKIATAVDIAKKEVATQKDNEFIQREKQPLKDYSGPSAYGSVKIKYPKTWSAYVNEKGTGDAAVDGYFHPNVVPGIDKDESYALRLQVEDQTFDQVVKGLDSKVKNGQTSAKAYKVKNVDGSVALRFDGEIDGRKTGTLIVVKLRDKTLKLWTEADQFRDDLFEHVLENLTFIP